jgi:hypothetical protein
VVGIDVINYGTLYLRNYIFFIPVAHDNGMKLASREGLYNT